MNVRRTMTTGWTHPVSGRVRVINDVARVEPIEPVQDKSEDLETVDWHVTYDKQGKIKYVRRGSQGKLLAKA